MSDRMSGNGGKQEFGSQPPASGSRRPRPTLVCQRRQSRGEEIANALSHGLGALLALPAGVLLIRQAVANGGRLALVCLSVYAASLFLLYAVSALYHGLSNLRAKVLLQVMDHCTIFLLIFGTELPILLLVIGGPLGWTLTAISGVCALTGVALNSRDLARWHKLSLWLYLAMGWMVVLILPALVRALPLAGLLLLFGGGVAYSAGVWFYRRTAQLYLHFVWHLLVLLGSALHFLLIYYYCCPLS